MSNFVKVTKNGEVKTWTRYALELLGKETYGWEIVPDVPTEVRERLGESLERPARKPKGQNKPEKGT